MAPPDPHLFLARPLKLEGGLSEIGGNEISQEGEKKKGKLGRAKIWRHVQDPTVSAVRTIYVSSAEKKKK